MGDRLAAGNVAIALLANSIATGAALVVLIATFAPISGAHFNPAVSIAEAWRGRLPWSMVTAYTVMQCLGALAGVVAAHAMFNEPLIALSHHDRTGIGQIVSEGVATFGLLLVIFGSTRRSTETVAAFVGLYIASAYWFTSSTSFANPAVTLGRVFTDTFAGISLTSVPGFLAGQLLGAIAAVIASRWFWSDVKT